MSVVSSTSHVPAVDLPALQCAAAVLLASARTLMRHVHAVYVMLCCLRIAGTEPACSAVTRCSGLP